MKAKISLSAFGLLGAMLITNTSCNKKTDCMASVICNDATGVPVRNANIELLAYVQDYDKKGTFTGDIRATGITDENGKVSFTFKLPAIFDINATKVVGTHTYVGTGIIKLEEGKGTEKTVTIK